MVKQNINLVTSLPARQSIYLSFRFIKVIYVSFIGVLVTIYLLCYAVDYFRSVNLSKLTKERTALSSEIAAIIDKTQKSNESRGLQENIKTLRDKILAQERVLKLLNTQQRSRFSVSLETVANQIPEKVWLDKIQIIPEKEFVFLSGNALEAPLVSEFVHNLGATTAFNAYDFKSVDVKSTKEDYFRFTITSESVSSSKTKGISNGVAV